MRGVDISSQELTTRDNTVSGNTTAVGNLTIISLPVLVLNQNYQPLNICHVRRALILLFRGKAEVLENGRGYIHSIDDSFDVPSVIRLASYVKRPFRIRKMTKLEVFNRDRYICQYCGRTSTKLTLDHVIPRHLSGEHTWENVVSACESCNRKKAGRTPSQAGMPLRCKPAPPKDSLFYVPQGYTKHFNEWHKYLSH
jgi:5-methylcytosine-specific restriction endonuclease McrA